MEPASQPHDSAEVASELAGMRTVMPHAVTTLVTTVVALGIVCITHSLIALRHAPPTGYLLLLAVVTIASGRFAIRMPGRPATVSVSEVFVFATILLFSPEAATLVVAIDGLWTSLLQEDRRLYRAMFNIAEPAISTWTAGQVYLATAGALAAYGGTTATVAAAIAMAAVFFVLNSGLTAIAIGLENRTSPYDIWRRHARYLAANYYAAASLAALAVSSGGSINVAIVALIVPLLIVSYLAYEEASTRVDEAHRHVDEIGRLYQSATEMLAIAVDTKDQVTHGHIRRVQRHTVAVARALGVTDPGELKAIEAGALLHDIGKLAVPDFVLNKPSGLTRAEFDIIKKHPGMGARILKAVDFPYPVVPIVRHHHEQWNGRGYPDGLVGAEIPIGARILAVVDCYDALTSDRPYRKRLDVDRAVEILQQRKGSFYDPQVVDTFVRMIAALERDDLEQNEAGTVAASLAAGLVHASVDPTAPRRNDSGLPAIPARAGSLIDRRIGDVPDAEACLFAFTREGDGVAVVHATPALRPAVAGLHLPLGGGVSGWVAGNRSTIRDAEPALDLGELAGVANLRSCTSTPVFVHGEVVGALTVYRRLETSEPEIVTLATDLAQHVGLLLSRPAGEPEDVFARFAVGRSTADYMRSAN